jgi:hypothetical protein
MGFGQIVKARSDFEQGRLPRVRFRPVPALQNPVGKIPLNRVKGGLQIPASAPNPANFSKTRQRDNHYSV